MTLDVYKILFKLKQMQTSHKIIMPTQPNKLIQSNYHTVSLNKQIIIHPLLSSCPSPSTHLPNLDLPNWPIYTTRLEYDPLRLRLKLN